MRYISLFLFVVVIGISSVAEGFEQQFTWLNPEEGAVLAPGETYTVDWSGGDPD